MVYRNLICNWSCFSVHELVQVRLMQQCNFSATVIIKLLSRWSTRIGQKISSFENLRANSHRKNVGPKGNKIEETMTIKKFFSFASTFSRCEWAFSSTSSDIPASLIKYWLHAGQEIALICHRVERARTSDWLEKVLQWFSVRMFFYLCFWQKILTEFSQTTIIKLFSSQKCVFLPHRGLYRLQYNGVLSQ